MMDLGITIVIIVCIGVLGYIGLIAWLISLAKSTLYRVIAIIAALIGTALIIDLMRNI